MRFKLFGLTMALVVVNVHAEPSVQDECYQRGKIVKSIQQDRIDGMSMFDQLQILEDLRTKDGKAEAADFMQPFVELVYSMSIDVPAQTLGAGFYLRCMDENGLTPTGKAKNAPKSK